jgi:hypothetical protein
MVPSPVVQALPVAVAVKVFCCYTHSLGMTCTPLQPTGADQWTGCTVQGRAGGQAAAGAAAGDGSHPGGAGECIRQWCADHPQGAIATVLRNLGASTWFQEAFLDLNRRLSDAYFDLGLALNIQHGETARPDAKR